MSGSVKWNGLAELFKELRTLPDTVTHEAHGIVTKAATDAATAIASGYPSRTGRLRRGVRVVQEQTGTHVTGARVQNTARHAGLFERGTQARHSALGNRGAMPPGRVFVPVVLRYQRGIVGALMAIVERHGFAVKGRAA